MSAPSGTDKAPELTAEVVLAAAELLSHYWTRPLPAEVELWRATSEVAETVDGALCGDRPAFPLLPAEGETAPDELLDEYERLFVGPGQVPCPPYESFWREDVPVDIRRTLMGPCTAELKDLYGELGLQVSAASGELPDHIAVEWEALACALREDSALPVARRLFGEHLERFVGRLCRAVSKESDVAFYSRLAVVTAAWASSMSTWFQEVGPD